MRNKLIIKNALIINEGKKTEGDVLMANQRIEKIDKIIDEAGAEVIDASGQWLIPGIIDDQVHFREPGLTHKANIFTESKAAVAGGVTSFMEMPNTHPPALTTELLEDKYNIAAETAWCNYSFFMGGGNDNAEELLKVDPGKVCGIKLFMGSSTGNMLVDNPQTLDFIFSRSPMLIATHCEDESRVRERNARFIEKYGKENGHAYMHPLIRDEESCLLSSSLAVELAKKHKTRLHILHISTEEEIALFRNDIPLSEKHITSEVCVHHLYFTAEDYEEKGNLIKCNPAIKDKRHSEKLFQALLDDHFDIIATDHAPHTLDEKKQSYFNAPSGLPLIQHSLNIMMDFMWQGKISMEKIVEKMCHAPAECFQLAERGYIREGYYADLVLIDPLTEFTVRHEDVYYKCGWTPLDGKLFKAKVMKTLVNGQVIYNNGIFTGPGYGSRLRFNRDQ
jgi:dihydroorotase